MKGIDQWDADTTARQGHAMACGTPCWRCVSFWTGSPLGRKEQKGRRCHSSGYERSHEEPQGVYDPVPEAVLEDGIARRVGGVGDDGRSTQIP